MKNYILLFSLIAVIVLAGCIGQTTTGSVRYKNDIVTIEEYSVDTLNPYAGSPATISFSIKNNGDKAVEWAEVNFFDIPNFEVVNLECEGISRDGNKCTFEGNDKLEVFDARKISLTLKAPPKDEIISSKRFTLSYSISYDYSGSRETHIPIIDGTTRKAPLSKFIQSSQTYGPVQVEFEPPVGRETKTDNRVVKEYWGTITKPGELPKPFKIEINFNHVGSSSLGKIQKVTILSDGITVNLNDLDRASLNEQPLVCDLCKFGETDCPSKKDDGLLHSKKNVTVPGKLICNLQSIETELPEITGIITIGYSYSYQYIKTETLTVQPIPEE